MSSLSPVVSPPPLWQRFSLAACMFLSTAAIGFLQPFVPLYLEAAGISRSQIGLVSGVGTGLALLVQPLLGRLSDRLDTRRPLMFLAATASGCAYLSYRLVEGLTAFILLTAIGVNGMFYLNATGGVLVGRMVGRGGGGGRAYTQYRVWGSIGYILVALLTGWMLGQGQAPRVLDRAELTPVFTYGPLIFFAVALFCLLVPDRKNAFSVSTPSEQKSRAGSALDENALSQNFRRFLTAFFFYQFALYGASAYISLYLKSLGATPLWITGTFATGVVCEVLVMTQVGRWSDLYGRRPALALAFLLMPLRLLLYIPATGPLWVLIVQSLHGFNFGIMGAIAVVFANDLATDRNRSATQARLTGVGGLATATGPMVCGWLAQYLSIGWMFAIMALFGTVGAAIFLTRVQESHPAPRALSERGPSFLHPFLRLLAAPPSERSETTLP